MTGTLAATLLVGASPTRNGDWVPEPPGLGRQKINYDRWPPETRRQERRCDGPPVAVLLGAVGELLDSPIAFVQVLDLARFRGVQVSGSGVLALSKH